MGRWSCSLRWLLVASICLNSALGLFEDQVGMYDWRMSFLGHVEGVVLESPRRLIVWTKEGILASLDAASGNIIWRKHVTDGKILGVVATDGCVVSLTSVENTGLVLLQSWSSGKATLLWEKDFEVSMVDSVFAVPEKRSVVVGGQDGFYAFGVQRGLSRWNHTMAESSGGRWIVMNDGSDIVYSHDGLGSMMQSVIGQRSFVLTEMPRPNFCSHNARHMVCVSSETSTLYLITHGRKQPVKIVDSVWGNAKSISVIDSDEVHVHVFVEFLDKAEVISVAADDVRSASLPEGTITVARSTPAKFLVPNSRALLLWDKTVASVREVHALSASLDVPPVAAYDLGGQEDTFLVVCADDSLVMFSDGHRSWIREEALASVLAVRAADLPISWSASPLEYMHASFARPGFIPRIHGQLLYVAAAVRHLVAKYVVGSETMEPPAYKQDGNTMTGDQFGIRKVLVIMTAARKLFGIDSSSGSIVWSKYLPRLSPISAGDNPQYYLVNLRGTSHYPLSPLQALVGQDDGSDTVLYLFDPLTGQCMMDTCSGRSLGFKTVQVSVLPYHDAEHMTGLVFLDMHQGVHYFPSWESLERPRATPMVMSMFHIDRASSRVYGCLLSPQTSRDYCVASWSLNVPGKVLSMAYKRSEEKVHSLGYTQADRSVVYKYLNPNLIAIAALTEQPQSTLVVLLVDGITGSIVHQVMHQGAAPPVHLVLSENWLVYVFTNSKLKRVEASVVELSEGTSRRNSTLSASMDVAFQPEVHSKAYVLPVSSVTAAQVSVTERGLTHRSLLLALGTGHVWAVPKMLLNPWRTFDVSPEQAEEGLVPYHPELQLFPTYLINFNKTVLGARRIESFATLRESTSLVLVCGLDMFATRISPSLHFDMLKEDFDYVLLSGSVIALLVVAVLAKYMSSRRSLHLAWS